MVHGGPLGDFVFGCLRACFWRAPGSFFLALPNLIEALRYVHPALAIVQRVLLTSQPRHFIATLALRLLDAAADDKASLAVTPALLEAGFGRMTFALDALVFGRDLAFGELRTLGREGSARQKRRNEKGGQRANHVSEVSTSRCAAPRYSGERISRNRDTVRGNSCASGPSVYNASAETAADRMSLTRRS